MSTMGHLGSNRSDKFFGPTHSTGCLDVTDALETVVSIKPQLEHSIEVLPKHGRIIFTASNDEEAPAFEFTSRRVIDAYERRLEILVTHPRCGYAVSYRRIFEVQARLLARFLLGEIESYPAFRTR